ncbi:Hypothetical predicted protein [Paramuricea clavata]|uniref:Uncharacterized protein n=1 Tax=Paramuricea clavata TaxID=317549 RepID=A0A7D9I5Q5_PARCT|nr:Hypothetical predicted protein [Paramuricea clavata]
MKKGKVICGAKRKLTYESDDILNASGPPANENTAQQETKYKKRKQEQEHIIGSRVVDMDTLKKGLSNCLLCSEGKN